ncbi:MAG: PDZ domain-containing protein [Acidobacteriota bacterium]|nr:PDZ domain-containing protein [Acidobacteriota bacterium]
MKKELENLNESDEKVRQMLASLKQVEAPKDFEFRLKARIANASPKAYQTSYKRRFAFALPAFASIAVSAFVVMNANLFSGTQQVSSIPESTAQTQTAFVQPQNSPIEFVAAAAANTTVNKSPEDTSDADSNARTGKDEKSGLPLMAVKSSEKLKNEIPKPASKENRDGGDVGGSKVSAVTVTEPIGPRGINLNPNKKVETPPDFNGEKSFSVQELLSPLGVEVAAENGRWKVKNVSPNSAAERSGIKADDVIETLDGQKLSGADVRGKKIEVKKLGVKRGGAQVEINLQTSPK